MPTLADIMTTRPAHCTVQSSLVDVARIMRDHDCGIVPVVEDDTTMRLVGVLTDRDIVIRLLAEGREPLKAAVADVFTQEVHVLGAEASIEECRRMMESRQIRRVPVVDSQQALVGIVSMADLANEMPDDALGRTLEEISEPDSRQLYSEVTEDNRRGSTITPVQHDGGEERAA